MQAVVSDNYRITETIVPGVKVPAGAAAEGVVFLDDDLKVIKLPSLWLTQCAYSSSSLSRGPTVKTYANNTIYFLRYLKSCMSDLLSVDEMIKSVRLSTLENWIRHQTDDLGLDKSTVRNREGTIRAMYAFLTDEQLCGALERSPFPGRYLSSKPDKKHVRALDIADVKALMLETDYERERIIFQLMFDSGARISEVPRITLGDIQDAIKFTESQFVSDQRNVIEPGYAPLLIKGSKGRGNSRKERSTIVTAKTLQRIQKYHSSPLYRRYLKEYRNHRDAPWVFNTEGKPYTTKSLSALFERVAKRAQKHGTITGPANPHRMRHGFAYLTLSDTNRGNDFVDRLVFVQKSLGHADIQTTENSYTSIPHDVYDQFADTDGVVLTRIEKMEELIQATQKRIKLGDVK